MKLENLALFGAVALGVYLLASKGLSLFGTARAGTVAGAAGGVWSNGPIIRGTEILVNALPGSPGYGWRYFTDGTSISPQGEYYRNGAKVWPVESSGYTATSYDGVSVGDLYQNLEGVAI